MVFKMNLTQAIEEVLREEPKTRQNKYLWLYIVKVLQKLEFKAFIEFETKLPSPDAMLTMRRTALNKKNKFSEDFFPEEGVTYEQPIQK